MMTITAMALLAAAPAANPCDGDSTADMNECLAQRIDLSKSRLEKYLAAAIERVADRPELVLGIQASQAAYEAYAKIECDAVYAQYAGGTIRGIIGGQCLLGLTDARTLAVWRNWLVPMDSSPPVLPEPKPE